MLSLWMLAAIVCQLQPSALAQAETALVPPQAGQAEIVETQLPPYAAPVVKIEPRGIQVKLGGEMRSIPFDQLLRTRFGTLGKPASNEKISVELADGSTIVCAQVTSDSKNVKIVWADQESISVPARQVTSCLLQPLDVARARQWQAIVDSKASADVLVVQRSAESLDKIEGVISEVTDAAVKFQFDGQTLDVQRTKLAGWKYFAPEASSRPKLLAVVRDRHGSSWMVQSIAGDWSSPNSVAEVKLVCGVDLKLATASVVDIDFSFGSMRFLADLQPLERKVQPRFSLAISLPEAEQLFGPRAARAASPGTGPSRRGRRRR